MTTSIIEEINMSIDKQTTYAALFSALLMNPRIKEHKEDSWSASELFFNGTSTIPKDTSRDDMNSYAVYVICDDCSMLPSKENQIPFLGIHYTLVNKIWETKSNINPSKHNPRGDRMLQCPIISTIVFKDPD
jgi:hypothetical protein